MIEKLKSVCVYEFSSKIKRIYEDIKQSAAQQEDFNQKYKNNGNRKFWRIFNGLPYTLIIILLSYKSYITYSYDITGSSENKRRIIWNIKLLV